MTTERPDPTDGSARRENLVRPDDQLAAPSQTLEPSGAGAEPPSITVPPEALAVTETVIDRYGNMVYGVAITHTACHADADDVFQEVFLAYHRNQPRCHDEEHRKAWLLRTTLNIARRIASSSWRTRVVPLTADDPPDPAAAGFTFATERQDAIFHALNRLPEGQRTVLYLFYFEDLPVSQIAGLLGLDPSAVKMRLSRGRAQMRDQLREDLFND
ncbi:MAG: sigma-70 family RNA polymerase sigma factor [Bifidobacteriaceae bacterium]|jgi:RNA polymerase sigma-70 factor (ECF subfamily)|nr:sigma-70 family RNA polymerase sigma factor [Bifidobacteriaceae bacterium]